jgi:hypothetical protein
LYCDEDFYKFEVETKEEQNEPNDRWSSKIWRTRIKS